MRREGVRRSRRAKCGEVSVLFKAKQQNPTTPSPPGVYIDVSGRGAAGAVGVRCGVFCIALVVHVAALAVHGWIWLQ